MAGKYDNYFKDYENQVKSSVFTGYADKQMNWISTSKDSPLIYVQLLQDELLPVFSCIQIQGSRCRPARPYGDEIGSGQSDGAGRYYRIPQILGAGQRQI